ncbi:hypothetical protein Mgra_00005755 [Meloidogyne graminicola]|uniref:Uncharacterized protein n=1 Tax=Meloidogyne graminicola TaxID=189291 RepID=A0A8S9ZNT7_9BILA|nr:hypothetical protein Mgra_00005755 [Meloidogyne graminicola]
MTGKRGRTGLIKRPTSGICQFCLKIISATNWSRHLQQMHKEEIAELKNLVKNKEKDEDRASPELSPRPKKTIKTSVLEKLKAENKEINTNIVEPNKEARPLRRSKRNAKSVKRKMVSRCTIKLPKSGICPLCFCKTRQSNWARHVKRHHPEYTTPINNNILEEKEKEWEDLIEPPGSSKSSTEIDLPTLQLKQFLNQQIQHNNLFGVEEEKEREEEEDVEKISIIKELERNDNELELNTENKRAEELLFKELFPGRRIIIRRPPNGICQFCLKQISASNWSRHLRTLHLADIFEMKKQELLGKIKIKLIFKFLKKLKIDQQPISPNNSQNELDTTQPSNNEILTLSATATITESKEIKIENLEISEFDKRIEREDSVDKTIASVIEGAKNNVRKYKRKLVNVFYRHYGLERKTKKSKSIIRLPKTNVCPLCFHPVSPGNWSRHLKRHHPDYALIPSLDEEEDIGEEEEEEEEDLTSTTSPQTSEFNSQTEEQALLWSLCEKELAIQSLIINGNKKIENIQKKINNLQNALSIEQLSVQELKLEAEQLIECRKELLNKKKK